jgi:hypothetical protein
VPARSSEAISERNSPRPRASIISNVSPSAPGAPRLRFASRYAASSVSSFARCTYSPQKRCAGADFARWPIFARSSCRLMVGFVIPLLPHFSLRMPSAGPFHSTGITPLHRYYEPVRQALAFVALRLPARATTLLPRFFSAGRGALPCFHSWPCARAAALYPAGWCPRRSFSRAPAAFAVNVAARHPEDN